MRPGRWCWRRDALGFDGDVEEGIKFLHYDDDDEDAGDDDGLGTDI